MNVLVDTHVLIWALTRPDVLTARAEEVLADPDTAVHVSTASAWEIATKTRIGKLPGGERLVLDYQRNLNRWFAFSLPIEDEDALLAGTLSWSHRDPFDRMIAAQAIRRGFALVSSDKAFDGVSGLTRVW